MTDRTHPEAGSTHIIRYALELGLLWIDGDGRDKVREALNALDALEAQLEAIGAGGLNGPLMGRSSLAASAGSEPVYQARYRGGFWQDSSRERCEYLKTAEFTSAKDWEMRILYTIPSPPEGMVGAWMPIETAPKDGSEVLANTAGLGRIVVYWDDDEFQWGTGLGYLHQDAPTHWMPLPPPPTTSAGSGKGE